MIIMQGLFSLDLFALKNTPLVYDYNHRLSGIVKIGSNPMQNIRVSVLVRGSNIFIDVVYSDIEGKFNFKGLPLSLDGVFLTVIAIDQTGVYNAVIADSRLTEGIGETR